jgi:hypothetical protein
MSMIASFTNNITEQNHEDITKEIGMYITIFKP